METQSQKEYADPLLHLFSTGSLLPSVLSTTPAGVILSSMRKSLILSLKGSTLKKPVFPYDDLLAALWYSAGRENQQLFP